jgi:hypothetical protein
MPLMAVDRGLEPSWNEMNLCSFASLRRPLRRTNNGLYGATPSDVRAAAQREWE